ncbi:stabilizer of axonemal microtubules 2-like [Hypomesus transpacificus]|uniref:stabilizer of axonemal microtubules 2-like n=1 Tax=Hypomesus transpacificus TaxID=137520 RepID=UPI001F085B18|nr:stabilizer of axonemal microtubules 2-like [Hypomesus transpacificus]
MGTSTTFRSDYVPHTVIQRPKPKASSTYITPTETMQLTTTYMRDFKPFSVNKNIVANRTTKHEVPTVKMDTQTLYKEDYQCWDAVRPEAIRTSDNLKVSEDKFSGTTTFQDHYCPKPTAEVRESFKPTPEIQESQPFEGISNYKQMYVPHQTHQRLPKTKVPYKPNSVPFCGVSIHRQDFKGLRGEVAKSFKTISTYEASTIPFKGCSETKDKYKAWPVQRSFQRKTATHCPPEGDIESISIAHKDFGGQMGEPAELARPPIKAWCQGKPFKARSTMKEDYRAWEAKKRSQVVRREQISPPSGAFETTTTNRSEYTKKSVPQAISFKPIPKAMSQMKLDDNTVYNTSYVTREFQPCPASFIDPPGFHYKSKGSGGHLLYQAEEMGPICPASATASIASAQPSHIAKSRPVTSAVRKWVG